MPRNIRSTSRLERNRPHSQARRTAPLCPDHHWHPTCIVWANFHFQNLLAAPRGRDGRFSAESGARVMSAVIEASAKHSMNTDHGSSFSASDRSPAEIELFSRQELDQFARDDEEAGRRIGKILATLFIYTLIAMSIVSIWTFQVVQ